MSIPRILSILAVVLLVVWMLFARGDKNRFYIKWILLAYPLLNAFIIPGAFAMNGFDLLTYIFFICFYKRRQDVHLKNNGFIYGLFFVCLLLFIIVGLWNSESIGSDVVRDVIDFFPIFLFAKIVTDECLEDPSFFYDIVKCIRITLITSLVFLCCQFVVGVQFSLSSVMNPNITGGVQRYPSFMGDPQVYSQYLAAVSFLCLIKNPEDPKLPIKNYVLLVLSLIGIMYTGGRGGFGGWAAGLFILIMFGNAKYRISALVTCAVLFIIVMNFGENFAIFQRGDDLADSYEDRYIIWRDAFQIFLDHSFFGIGLGNYSNYVSVHNPDQFWMVGQEVVYFDHPESGYLKLMAELGATGFVTVLAFVFTPLINGFILFIKKKDISLILMIAAVFSWLVAFYTVYSLGDIRIKILIATLLCLLITSNKRIEQEQQLENEEEIS